MTSTTSDPSSFSSLVPLFLQMCPNNNCKKVACFVQVHPEYEGSAALFSCSCTNPPTTWSACLLCNKQRSHFLYTTKLGYHMRNMHRGDGCLQKNKKLKDPPAAVVSSLATDGQDFNYGSFVMNDIITSANASATNNPAEHILRNQQLSTSETAH
jgi:hypothetical protein